MHISTRGRYGSRALLALANRSNGAPVSSKTISTDEEISHKYLERLWHDMKKAGLVEAQMGVAGGYRLARPATEINMYEVLTALGERFDIVHCTSETACCPRGETCKTRALWQKMRAILVDLLESISLADLEACGLIAEPRSGSGSRPLPRPLPPRPDPERLPGDGAGRR